VHGYKIGLNEVRVVVHKLYTNLAEKNVYKRHIDSRIVVFLVFPYWAWYSIYIDDIRDNLCVPTIGPPKFFTFLEWKNFQKSAISVS
jgi:hypothetical protein